MCRKPLIDGSSSSSRGTKAQSEQPKVVRQDRNRAALQREKERSFTRFKQSWASIDSRQGIESSHCCMNKSDVVSDKPSRAQTTSAMHSGRQDHVSDTRLPRPYSRARHISRRSSGIRDSVESAMGLAASKEHRLRAENIGYTQQALPPFNLSVRSIRTP
ncbi:hypothetical protein IE81DRAFT_220310 [Ceraceosorus guamensis]|uniref:Uncharacterized protein n=1 Tax=Ceraceosorus guamensis TaxID=1522189 RepID=A0A316VUA8_9BASI|nr:hypothetical protein IE81DRAFT_220310 [Ceraceosorus guamensis]PWN40478.1 hypothetical protein IE81DRAFT_220310 [Ceraceosorus guamensis]